MMTDRQATATNTIVTTVATVIGIISLIGSVPLFSVSNLIGIGSLAVGLPGLAYGLWARRELRLQNGPAYTFQHVRYVYHFPDPTGSTIEITAESVVSIRRRQLNKGGGMWETASRLTKFATGVRYADGVYRECPVVKRPTREGARYDWDAEYVPPLRRGDVVTLVDTFTLQGAAIKSTFADTMHPERDYEKFTWIARLPQDRPAKRWWVTADYIPGKADGELVKRSESPTTEIVCEIPRPVRNAIYHLYFEW
jgi:hypothetical protein